MATRQLAVAARRCNRCQSNALYAFASLAGVSLPPPPKRAIPSMNTSTAHKSFSTSLIRKNDDFRLEHIQVGHAYDASTKSQEVAEATSQHGDSSLPWYLQVTGPPKHISPLSARQQLPPIPEDSPELLKPFLEHLSENIGLDDLILLDLRVLDPPPALGANLMMVIGTARSERHLHVSADRFCRWLRTNHKLSPYADGLLGRNELKLKMRRKARRIKLLSSVGSTDDKNVDDGIRTGWVCVNVGEIEHDDQGYNEVDKTNGFVGFGGGRNGAKLVVQMMTEEKREELDLERLWGGYVIRQQRKEAREAKKDGKALLKPVDQVGETVSKIRSLTSASPSLLSQPLDSTDSTRSTMQQRGMHTASPGLTRFRKHGLRQKSSRGYSNSAGVNTSYEPSESLSPVQSVKEMIPPSTNNSGIEIAHDLDPPSIVNLLSEEDIEAELTNLIKHLDCLSPEDAREALGQGPHDRSSTPFLQAYYQYTKRLGNIQKVRFRGKLLERRVVKNYSQYHRVLLLSRGVVRQHERYTKDDLVGHLHSLQEIGAVIEVATYAEYIKGLATPDYELDVISQAAVHEHHQTSEQEALLQTLKQGVVSRKSLDMILEVLEDMQMRGYSLAHEEILPVLCEALARSQVSEQAATQPRVNPGAVHGITQIMFRHRLPVMSHSYYEQLLDCFANAKNWTGYWQCWRGLARRSQSRTAKLYQNLFRHMANTGNQKMCLDALREWIPELERESPPIELQGDEILVYEIARCLRIADPRSEQMAAKGEQLGEWRRLWERLFVASQPAHETQEASLPAEHVDNPGFWSQSFTEDRLENTSNVVDESDDELGGQIEDMEGDFSHLSGLKT